MRLVEQSDTGRAAAEVPGKLGPGRVPADAVWLIGARSLGWGFVGTLPVVLFVGMVTHLVLTPFGRVSNGVDSVVNVSMPMLAPVAVVVFSAAREARPPTRLWRWTLVGMGIGLPMAIFIGLPMATFLYLPVWEGSDAVIWYVGWACAAAGAAGAGTILVPVLCKVLRAGPGVPLWWVAVCSASGIGVSAAVWVYADRHADLGIGIFLPLWEAPVLLVSAAGCSVVIAAWRSHERRARASGP